MITGRFFNLGQDRAEPIQTSIPQRSSMLEPLRGGGQTPRVDPAGADSAHLLRADKSAPLQHLKVLDNGGQRDGHGPGQIADRGRPQGKLFNDSSPGGIAQRVEHLVRRQLLKHPLEYRLSATNGQVET